MSKKVIIYPIGNSDISFQNHKIDKRNFRNETQNWRDALHQESEKLFAKDDGLFIKSKDSPEKLSFPIFTQMLSYLKKNEKIEKNLSYFLIFTDQEDKNHSTQDTIFLKDIFKIYLNKKGVLEDNIKEIKIEKNPTDINYLLDFFEDYLSKNKVEFGKFDEIFLITGPGTPQINLSLLIVFSALENINIYYTSKSDNEKTLSIPINFKLKFEEIFVKRTVEKLINNYDYISAVNIYQISSFSNKPLLHLLKSITDRFNFDFENSYKNVRHYFSEDNRFSEFKRNVENLKDREQEELLKELYYQFCLRILSRRYLEAIGMVFRFEEEILKRCIEKIWDLKIEKKESYEGLKNKIEESPELIKKLKKNEIRYKEPSRITYQAIINFLFESEESKNIEFENRSLLRNIKEFYKELESKSEEINLIDIRNQSPFAHGFEGISEEKLQKIYGSPVVLMEKFSDILNKMGITIYKPRSPDFPFKKINSFIIEELQK